MRRRRFLLAPARAANRLALRRAVVAKASGSRMAFGSSRMAFGSSQMALGSSRLPAGSCQLPAGSSQMALGSSRLAFGSSRMAFGSSRMAFGSSQMAFGSSRMAFGSSRLASGSSRLASGSSRLASGGSWLASWRAQACPVSTPAEGEPVSPSKRPPQRGWSRAFMAQEQSSSSEVPLSGAQAERAYRQRVQNPPLPQ